ncbi:hypothetical protein BH10ACT1_BH10ACT1_32540 [soil metagenome]
MLYWIGAPAERLFGSVGVLVVFGLVSVVSLAVAFGAAHRLGGRPLLLSVGVASAVLVHSLGPQRLVDPWNPYLTYLPLLGFLLAAAATAEAGPGWTLPAAVALGSLAAQSHLGAVPVVGVASLGAIVWRRTVRRQEVATTEKDQGRCRPGSDRTRPNRRLTIASAVLGLALWSGPLVQQVTGHPGNLGAIATYVLEDRPNRPAMDASLRIAARELGVRPAWTGGPEVDFVGYVAPGQAWTLLLTFGALAGAWWISRHQGDRTTSRLLAYVTTVVAISVLAVTRTTDGFFPYVLRWTWPVAALAAAAAARPLLRALDRSRPVPRRWSWTVGVPVLALLIGATATAASTADAARHTLTPSPLDSRIVGELARETRAKVPRGHYYVADEDSQQFAGIGESLGAQLMRSGYRIRFPASSTTGMGPSRTGSRKGLPMLLVLGGSFRTDRKVPPGSKLVATFRVGTPAQDAERRRLVERLDAGTSIRADLERLAEIPDTSRQYDVYLVPGTQD